MFCSKCGFQNNSGEMFCKQCGSRLENVGQVQQPMNNQPPVNNQQPMNYQQPMPNGNTQPYNNGIPNQNYINNAVNPNMKGLAIASIIVPAAGILWYTFVGLSVLMAILIAAGGYELAKMGEPGDPKLAKVGKILSIILVIMAFVMYVLYLIEKFA